MYFQSSLLSTQKVIIPVLPKTLKYTVCLKPRQSKTYQADWTRWQLIFLSQEASQRQEVIECDDRQLPWKMSSWVHQEVAPEQIPRYSPPILLVTWCFQRGRINRLLSGSSAIKMVSHQQEQKNWHLFFGNRHGKVEEWQEDFLSMHCNNTLYTNALVECDTSSHDTDINIQPKYAKTKKLNFFTGITKYFNSFSAKCQWNNEGVHGISAWVSLHVKANSLWINKTRITKANWRKKLKIY